MITVDQALERILSYVDVLSEEDNPILEALGQVVSQDVTSAIDVPPLDNSAMDGYAVRAADTAGASSEEPRVLRVIDSVAAGYVSRSIVEEGTAVRIMTGAPVPPGADAVVKFEDSDECQRQGHPQEIGILHAAGKGDNIRRAGEDIARGGVVLKRGTLLRPQEVGVLASLGMVNVSVFRRPVVAILATGDELVDIGEPLPEGKIYNSNTYGLAAQVRRYGALPQVLGIARDREDSVIAGLRRGLDADILITSGGVSVGDYDLVKDVLAQQGKIDFWTIKMKPGKPIAFGVIDGECGRQVPHVGLPGNPVSSMISFELFIRPAILKMMGRHDLAKPVIKAVVEEAVVNSDGRRMFTRVKVENRGEGYVAHVTGPQGSGILTSMTSANGLMIIPEDTDGVRAGDVVDVMMLDWAGS